MSTNHGKRWLLETAKTIARELQKQNEGTTLRIHPPEHTLDGNTDGWYAVIGSLGKGKPTLEIWLDRFSSHAERKLCACFQSRDAQKIQEIIKNLPKELRPDHKLTDADTQHEKVYMLKQPLEREHFKVPIQENYDRDRYYYLSYYDPTRLTQSKVNQYFCERAVAFFLDIAHSQPGADAETPRNGVYPQFEIRKLVDAHLRRERSRMLATECKIRDGHQCQVCRMKFADTYGEELGAKFAEAHHMRPLAKLPDNVKTQLEDLVTVCANCHRMLHRMAGKPEDIEKLKAIYNAHKKKQRYSNTERIQAKSLKK